MSPERSRINLFDVAASADVSLAIASRILCGDEAIAPPVRERVQNTIRSLGYRPDSFARALGQGRRGAIALAAPFGGRPFQAFVLPAVLEGVTVAASLHGWHLHYVLVPQKGKFPVRSHAESVDATIVLDVAAEAPSLAPLLESDHPVVLLNRIDEGFASAAVDNRRGGATAVEHLVSLEHRRIALLTGSGRIGEARLEGARAALRAAGTAAAAETNVEWKREQAKEEALRLLRRAQRPTALFAFSDWMAFGALTAAAEAGLRVPDDVSIVGFDDCLMSEETTPSLTTIRQPFRMMGESAVAVAAGLLGDVSVAMMQVQLAPELVRRGTTGPAPRRG